jgi:hypothetical protein
MTRRTLLALLAFLAAPPLAAQVGHSPETSPYRDIRFGTYLVATGGRVFGDGGQVGVAPHDGASLGLRFVMLGNRPLQVSFSVAYADLERLLQDPSKPPATRTSGPVSQRVLWADLGFPLNITGNKSWHGIAPFVGAAGGFSFSESIAEDTTGFRMGNKVYFAPLAGTRIFLGQRLYLLLEARAFFWSVKYPTSYRLPPSIDLPPVVTSGASEWTATPWLQAGLGWAFSLPF